MPVAVLKFMCGNSSCKKASICRYGSACTMYMLVRCACAQLVLALEHARSRAHRVRRQFGAQIAKYPAGARPNAGSPMPTLL